MSGNAPNLVDGHTYCENEDCWNVIPDNGRPEFCSECYHCEDCDPSRFPEIVRSLARMRPEALRKAFEDLPKDAGAAHGAEAQHLFIRAALCKEALAVQSKHTKQKRRK